jgi:SAM-dependent methyltransferase
MKPLTTYERPELHTYLDATLQDPHHHRILTTVLQHFDLRAGDAVVEIGSGSGRYTEWLLNYGLHVTAVEPDPQLRQKLEYRLRSARHLRVVQSDIGGMRKDALYGRAVCGFHLLHHLDAPTLAALAKVVHDIRNRHADFTGWFFLEPNPRNPLYPLQIVMTPGMKLTEEAGIWRNDYQSALGSISDNGCELGTLGFFPPRAVVKHLPDWLLRRGTDLKRGKSLLRLYTLYGHRQSR